MRIEALAVVLTVVWGLGMLASFKMGGFIHLPMLAAIAILCARIVAKPQI